MCAPGAPGLLSSAFFAIRTTLLKSSGTRIESRPTHQTIADAALASRRQEGKCVRVFGDERPAIVAGEYAR